MSPMDYVGYLKDLAQDLPRSIYFTKYLSVAHDGRGQYTVDSILRTSSRCLPYVKPTPIDRE